MPKDLDLMRPFFRLISSLYFDPLKMIPVYEQLTNINMLFDDLEENLLLQGELRYHAIWGASPCPSHVLQDTHGGSEDMPWPKFLNKLQEW